MGNFIGLVNCREKIFKFIDFLNFCYFDISGMKTYKEACSFVLKESKGENHNIITREVRRILINNDITSKFLNSIDCKCEESML